MSSRRNGHDLRRDQVDHDDFGNWFTVGIAGRSDSGPVEGEHMLMCARCHTGAPSATGPYPSEFLGISRHKPELG